MDKNLMMREAGASFLYLSFSLSMFRVTNFKFLKNVEERNSGLSLARLLTRAGEILSIHRTHARARA